ncbi:MAG: prepilin-type cleavage/methylation domain-containing protein [Candidatus Neomarinimicrobiota bacterium]|nr:MAG: prepilin-type cleavage/methylation domain-containing protein [Candidatus Neomarinimicrobiota bacterium]
MKKLMNESGFTLVELMIVIVIVGILAAVAVPIYQSNIAKAKMTECDAALGTIRTALRVYYAANNAYPTAAAGTAVTSVSGLDISTADLTGKYFTADLYTLASTDSTYTITCDSDGVLGGTDRTLDHNGNFGGGPS